MYPYPGQQGGYPPPQGIYQQQNPYPPQGAGGYPPPQGIYPPQGAGGFPQGYPPQQGIYQQQNPYPPQGAGGYPPPPVSQGSVAYPPTSQGSVAYPPTSQGSVAYPPVSQGSVVYPPVSQGSVATPPQGTTPTHSNSSLAYPPQQGYGYPPQGYPPQGYPPQGYPPQGYPPQGYPPQGYPPPSVSPVPGGQTAKSTNYGENLSAGVRLLTQDEITKVVTDLRNSMKGIGTDEKTLIRILGTYPPIQMNQIVLGYKSHFGKALEDNVKSETSGNFGKLAVALSTSILDFDVYCLHDAISGLGTDEDCLIEILVGRTNADIYALKNAYKSKYRNDIENDVKGDTSGYLRRLLIVLLQGNRDETNISRDVEADINTLYRAGEGKLGTDEMAFISLLCNRSDSHLRNVFAKYQQKYGSTIEKVIKKEFSGDIEKALLALVKSVMNRSEYIAELFEKSMAGMGTKDNKLIRLTVRYRAPNIIKPVKDSYQLKYGKTLAKRIKGDTSGDYRRLLLTCIGEPNS